MTPPSTVTVHSTVIERLRIASLMAAGLAMAAGCLLHGEWIWGVACLGIALAGWVWRKRLAGETGEWIFGLVVAAAALGVSIGLSTPAMLVAVIAAIVYWDLNAFQVRLAQMGDDGAEHQLEKAHLKRLAWVSGLGLALGFTALLVNFNLTFGWAVILGLLIIFGVRFGISAVDKLTK